MITYKFFSHKEHIITLSAIELYKIQKIEQVNNVPNSMIDQIIEWDLAYSDKVIIAYKNNKAIGFFRYDLGKNSNSIYAAGTFIIKKYRNKGLAFYLWEQVIELEKPNTLYAHAESLGGINLIEKIKLKYNNIKYDITYNKKLGIDKLNKAS